MSKGQNEIKLNIARLFQELGLILKQNMRKEFEDLDMTMPQSMVIGILMKHGAMKVSALSEHLGFTNSTTSGILDRLEKQGMILRERSEEDRRVVNVSLSNQFCKNNMNFQNRFNGTIQNMLQSADDKELECILEGLMVLKQVLVEGPSRENQELNPL